ncbi:MAG: peptidoglycan glycosyltransferase [Bacteroidetes bacterium OLB9]|nr:MAG: peptidoglycan glycosyltransferase [Bacteroidetes bacterium OLB9]
MRNLENRKYSVYYFIVLASIILIGRAAYLQLISPKYKEQAQRTTLEKKLIYPSRGLIFDRNGKTLIYNKPIYVLYATYRKIDPKMDTLQFCSLLGIDKETFIKNLEKDWSNPQFHKSIPFVFLSKISPEQFALFQEHLYKFPGFTAVERSIRGYQYPFGGHIYGYLGEVDKRIIENSDGLYVPGDFIGKTGIEIAYESALAGKKGVKYILLDNLGRQVESYDNGRLDSMAIPGEDIKISIDIDLQAYADSLMMNKKGGLVAIEPSTGEILAMVSAPSYDPNLLSLDENRSEAMMQLLFDTINRPLNNRAVTNKYPPGSIFKPILSLIALQKGVTWEQRSIPCMGGFRLSATKK